MLHLGWTERENAGPFPNEAGLQLLLDSLFLIGFLYLVSLMRRETCEGFVVK